MPPDVMSARFAIEPTHPALQGHFAGNPVVPGAVLIGLVDATLAHAGRTLTGIERAKFRRPVVPGEEVHVSIAYTDGSTVTFELRSRGDIVAHGTCWIRVI
jgi:3-hydroxymyristoyl/3-hydroxydecanoyl-(acyl carrier protein) dehydratase